AGASGSGKSTLAAALVARGASYLGDEATGLDPERRVLVSNPKPLGLDAAGRSALSSSVAATKDRDSFPLVAPAAIGAWVPAGTNRRPSSGISVNRPSRPTTLSLPPRLGMGTARPYRPTSDAACAT